jgi:16S rRNA (guanine527-N7)-methyltransferase
VYEEQTGAGREQPGLDLLTQGQQGFAGVQGFERHAGVPLAVACPERELTLIDGTAKKIRFVVEGIEALGIRNAQALHARAENYPGEKGFDVVVVRAVGSLADVLHNTAPLLAPRGRLFAMKGRLPEDELRALPRGWRADVIDLVVPGLDAERHLVVISRQRAA